MNNKPKPDDRRDNVDKIKNNIDNTISNYRETEKVIDCIDDEKQKDELLKKNMRRDISIQSLRKEIREEAIDKKNGYK